MDSWHGELTFPCIEVTQPIGTFYMGVIDSQDLIEISYADIRRVEERDVERYLGIQRPLSPKRVRELKQYVTNVDATFPTSVILAISGEDAVYDESAKIMKLNRDSQVAKIIDGQHRLAGLEDYDQVEQFQINVAIFIDMDIENQAMVFATINLAQTKVSKSLVYDLYELTKARSPQKTSHNIAKLFNSREGSPFVNRIKMLGRATEKYQTLTQAAVVEAFIKYISGDPLSAMKDRDLLLRGRSLPRASKEEERRLIFRNMFIDELDAEIAKTVWNFFVAVRSKWPSAWDGVEITGNILPRTNGFRALMRLFRSAYLHLDAIGKVIPSSEFSKLLEPIEISEDEFTSKEYKPGSSGESDLYSDLLGMSSIRDPDESDH